MKLKKLSLVVLCSGVILGGCNSNAGDDNDPTRAGNNSYVTTAAPNTVTTKQLTAAGNGSFTNYAVTGLAETFLSNGIFAIPGGLFTNWLSDWLFGDSMDPILDKLDQIQESLTKIDEKLTTNLALSQATVEKLQEFMKKYENDQIRLSFKELEETHRETQNKYDGFKTQGVFAPNITAKDLDKIYNLAKGNCNSRGIYEAIDAKSSNSTRKLQSGGAGDFEVDDIYTNFKNTYITVDPAAVGSFWSLFKLRRDRYLKDAFASVLVGGKEDKMDYVNFYNSQAASYAAKLFNTYQTMYNMQLAQLSYSYACDANIEMENLNVNHTIKGLDGFKTAVNVLNKTYNANFTELQQHVAKYMGAVDNNELRDLINNELFAKTHFNNSRLLQPETFVVNPTNTGECQINSFTTSSPNGSNEIGLADIQARCIVDSKKNGNKLQVRTSNIHQQIPFIREGVKITKSGLYGINLDFNGALIENDGLTSKASFRVHWSSFEDLDVLRFGRANDFSGLKDWSHMMNFSIPTHIYGYRGIRYNNWPKTSLSANAQTFVVGARGFEDYGTNSDFYAGYDGPRFPDARDTRNEFVLSSGYDGDINQMKRLEWDVPYNGDQQHIANWYLATANGMVFTVKVEFVHWGDQAEQYQKRIAENVIGEWVGVGCLSSLSDSCINDPANNRIILDNASANRNSVYISGRNAENGTGSGSFSIETLNFGQATIESEIDLPKQKP